MPKPSRRNRPSPFADWNHVRRRQTPYYPAKPVGGSCKNIEHSWEHASSPFLLSASFSAIFFLFLSLNFRLLSYYLSVFVFFSLPSFFLLPPSFFFPLVLRCTCHEIRFSHCENAAPATKSLPPSERAVPVTKSAPDLARALSATKSAPDFAKVLRLSRNLHLTL